MNIGFVGLGKMGTLHLRNSRFVDGTKAIAAADCLEKNLKKARSMGINRLYTDYKVMFNKENLHAVVLSLPNFLHAEVAIAAAEEGINIFIDKPLGRTVDECNAIIKAARANNIKLTVGHNYRYFECIKRIKEVYESGSLGNIESVSLDLIMDGPFSHPLEPRHVPDWWFSKELSGGGALLDLGSHLIDLFNWFFPDVEVLYSSQDYKYNLDIEDSAIVILKSNKTGTKGIVNVGWYMKSVFPSFNFRMNVHGTAGFISTDNFSPSNLMIHAIKASTINFVKKVIRRKINPLEYTYYYNSFYNVLDEFCYSVKRDTVPPIPPEDGMETLSIIEDAYKFAKRSRN